MHSADMIPACTSSFRQLYLRRLLRALRSVHKTTVENLSFMKRRRRIKLAADISLALTSNGTVWSHALMTNISKLNKDKSLLRDIVGKKKFHNMLLKRNNSENSPQFMVLQTTHDQLACMQKQAGRKRVLRRYMKGFCNKNGIDNLRKRIPSYKLARNLIQKRTKQLKSLIPGGNSMDSYCLLREAADYIISLKTQVDVMQSLANAVQCRSLLSFSG
eukprot:Gb_41382 [translate_table: standard]